MSKIVEMIKNGQRLEAKELFNVVNDFVLTTLKMKSNDGHTIMAMQVNKFEEHKDEYEFSQSCSLFDSASYYLKKDDIESVQSEYNAKVDTLYFDCNLKNGTKIAFMIINVANSGDRTKDYEEMDVYELDDFLHKVILGEDGYYCVMARVTDCFGFDIKMKNVPRIYVNTFNKDDWKLHISDDFTELEIPITDDSINEIYVKTDKKSESKHIIVKPFNQPFMEIEMLFFNKQIKQILI